MTTLQQAAKDWLLTYYGENDSRAYEQDHIDIFLAGFEKCRAMAIQSFEKTFTFTDDDLTVEDAIKLIEQVGKEK